MSDVDETKAGHPPAVKVGNMRVSSHRTRTASSGSNSGSGGGDKPSSAEEIKRQETEFQSSDAAIEQPKQGQIIAGAVVPETKAFTPEAVKAYHEKPMPTHEKPHAHVQQQMHHIHQPRK